MGYPNEPGAVRGSETSEEAGRLIKPHAESMHHRILDYVSARSTWGATSKEVGEVLKMKAQTVSARFAELRESGQIKRTMTKRTTQGPYKAFVYITKEVAEAYPEIKTESRETVPTSDKVLREQIKLIQHASGLLDTRMDEYLWSDRLRVLSRRLVTEAKKLEKML